MKKIISLLLCLAFVCSLSVAAFADGTQVLTMKMDRNGRSVFYEDGTRVPYSVWEDVVEEFHRLRHGVGVNWDLFDYEEMTFELDENGDVTALTQYLIGNDGRKIETSDPNVTFIDSPDKFHASGAGEAQVTVYDADGNALSTSDIKVTGASFSSFVLVNECGKCGEDQGKLLHLMSCGHFSCDVGREGHGDAACGDAGHYACDGDDHSQCSNCLKHFCNGKEHGAGVCPHVHTRAHAAWSRVPTCTVGGVEHIYCPGCGSVAIVQTPPAHTWGWNNVCVFCGQVRTSW